MNADDGISPPSDASTTPVVQDAAGGTSEDPKTASTVTSGTTAASATPTAAAPPARRTSVLDSQGLRIACGVIGGLLIIVALLVFGAFGVIQSFVAAFSGQTLVVLLLLVLGTLLAAVALLGSQIGAISRDVIMGSLQWVVAVIVYLCAAWLVLTNQKFFSGGQEPSPTSARWQGITLGVISVLFLLVVTVLMVRSETLAKTFSGKSSIAPTVVMLWSIVVVYAIAFIAAIALTSNNPGDLECPTLDDASTPAVDESKAPENCVVASAWSDYLLLLGIPGVAAALGKSRLPTGDGGDVEEGETAANEQNLTPSSLTTDKITEVQFFVFNAIAMIFVLWSLATRGVLGEIPDVLLGLTGASALTFSLAKRLPAAAAK